MLVSAEELLLFLLDEQTGTFLPLTERTEDLVLAGAVLMDLQLANRIDTDLDELTLSDPTPVGDDVLDPTLAAIAAGETTHGALYWVERTARRGRQIRERTIDRLISRGILLEPGDDGFLSLSPEVAHARRYPATNGVAQEHIRLRVMRVLFSDEIPDPADIVIISLLDACDVWRKLLTPEELKKARRRIETVSRLELIGRAVATLVRMVRPTARADRRRAVGLPLARGLPLIGSTLAVGARSAGVLRAGIPAQRPGLPGQDRGTRLRRHRRAGRQPVRIARRAHAPAHLGHVGPAVRRSSEPRASC